MAPALSLRVENTMAGDGSELAVQLRFQTMIDFEPYKVAVQIGPLRELLETRTKIVGLLVRIDRSEVGEALLAQILQHPQQMKQQLEADLLAAEGIRGRFTETLLGVTDLALQGRVSFEGSVSQSVTFSLARLDAVLSRQLAAILHHPEFQKLEASWRGLHHLVTNTETSASLQIKVLNVSKKELLRDFQKATEFDLTTIYKKLYSDEIGTPGGEPFALVGDFEFGNHPDDFELLCGLSQVAAACFCPLLSAASPALFDFRDWADLGKPRQLAPIFDTVDRARWQAFRASEDSPFVALVLPRVLARLPYGSQTRPVEEFNFEEAELDQAGKARSIPHEHSLWMNAAYVLAAAADGFVRTARHRHGHPRGGGRRQGRWTPRLTSSAPPTATSC